MGKNRKHKKIVKSEKWKMKLKVGAKFNFDGLLTNRKLNFKDLLVRLNHHNCSAKSEACEGLIELVRSSSTNMLELHLYSIIHGVCKLVLDIEKKVRQIAIKLLSDVIEKVSSEKIFPFFDILRRYALCALTSMDMSIQDDSFLIIDAYLKHAPLLIVNSFDEIFIDFLPLVSICSFSKLSQTLTINLSSKMTSNQWRVKVLARFRSILQLMIDEKSNVNEVQNNCKVVYVDDIGHTVPLYKGVSYAPINFLNYTSPLDVHTGNKMQERVGLLLPRLYETWAEAVPLSNICNVICGATVIRQDVASLLSCVTDIFYLLWELLKISSKKNDDNETKKLFLANGGQKFVGHIFNWFPYCQQDVPERKMTKDAKLLELNMDPRCIQENILICYMFCVLYKTFPCSHYVLNARRILDYLKVCLVSRNYVLGKNIETLAAVLRIVFFENSKAWAQSDISVEGLLDNVIHFHRLLKEENYGKTKIFQLLCDIIQLPHLRSRIYEKWLRKLPALLGESEISIDIIKALSLLSRQNNKLFLDGLLEELPRILANLPSMQIKGSNLYPPHLIIVNMFYYLSMKEEHIKQLTEFVKCNETSKIAKYVQEILDDKSRNLMTC